VKCLCVSAGKNTYSNLTYRLGEPQMKLADKGEGECRSRLEPKDKEAAYCKLYKCANMKRVTVNRIAIELFDKKHKESSLACCPRVKRKDLTSSASLNRKATKLAHAANLCLLK
jgi:hypothetical protein